MTLDPTPAALAAAHAATGAPGALHIAGADGSAALAAHHETPSKDYLVGVAELLRGIVQQLELMPQPDAALATSAPVMARSFIVNVADATVLASGVLVSRCRMTEAPDLALPGDRVQAIHEAVQQALRAAAFLLATMKVVRTDDASRLTQAVHVADTQALRDIGRHLMLAASAGDPTLLAAPFSLAFPLALPFVALPWHHLVAGTVEYVAAADAGVPHRWMRQGGHHG